MSIGLRLASAVRGCVFWLCAGGAGTILVLVLLFTGWSVAADRRPATNPYAQEIEAARQRLQSGEKRFAESFAGKELGQEWIVEEGDWRTCRSRGEDRDGVIGLPGAKYPDSFLWTKRSFQGDIAIEFDAECLSEPANDINFVICGKSPNYPPPEAKLYLFGLGGWGNTRSGVERAPDYKWKALTGRFTIRPRKSYHILAGRMKSVFYLFVDGELIIQARDPDPLPAEGQFAFHVYRSTVRFANLVVRASADK